MRQAMRDVLEFHDVFEVPVLNAPAFPSKERVQLRIDLVQEEYTELMSSCFAENLVGVADGITDLIYVLTGMALEFGIPLPEVWDEVHRSNMAKADPATGKAIKRADGKVIKPPGWKPPDIKTVIYGSERETTNGNA